MRRDRERKPRGLHTRSRTWQIRQALARTGRRSYDPTALKTPHHQNVCRHDHKRYHAWAVSIRRRGRVLSRYFADRKHGGRRQALQAALAFRDHALDALPPLLFVMRHYVLSKTGVVGVRLQVDRKPQGFYRAYVASWPEPSGTRRTRSPSPGTARSAPSSSPSMRAARA